MSFEKKTHCLEYQLNVNTALLSSLELYSASFLQAFADHCSPSVFGHLKGTTNPKNQSAQEILNFQSAAYAKVLRPPFQR